MRKNELIHLHALLAEVRGELTDEDEERDTAFREYERHGVGPTQIHLRKRDHTRAVKHLGRGLAQLLTEEEVSRQPSRRVFINEESE